MQFEAAWRPRVGWRAVAAVVLALLVSASAAWAQSELSQSGQQVGGVNYRVDRSVAGVDRGVNAGVGGRREGLGGEIRKASPAQSSSAWDASRQAIAGARPISGEAHGAAVWGLPGNSSARMQGSVPQRKRRAAATEHWKLEAPKMNTGGAAGDSGPGVSGVAGFSRHAGMALGFGNPGQHLGGWSRGQLRTNTEESKIRSQLKARP
jgi:hypothetical protein